MAIRMKLTEIIKESRKDIPFKEYENIFVDEISSVKSVDSLKIIINENEKLFEWVFNSEPLYQHISILEKMILFNLVENRINTEEELDNLIDEKLIYFDSLKDLLLKADNFLDVYNIYMKTPWSIDSEVFMFYADSKSTKPNIEGFSSFLPLVTIKDELLPDYSTGLKNLNIFNYENLIKMFIFYAINDSHMDFEKLYLNPGDQGYEDIYKTDSKGGFSIWGAGKFNYKNL